jgi:iron complex transport system substrate-binding protein
MRLPVGVPLAMRVVLLFAISCVSISAACAAQTPASLRIVSLAPHLTELAFDAGAGERIVATVEYSDHPQAARNIPRIGDAFRVDLERLVQLNPDAVLAWESGTPVATIERIRSLNLRVVVLATRQLADVATVVREIGKIAGTADIAERAATRFERDVGKLRATYRNRPTVQVFVQINEQPLYTVNGKQIISEIVTLCGGRNVFAELRELAPTIGIEAVMAAQPDVILSMDAAVPDAYAQWQRWKTIRAVQLHNVYMLNPDDTARSTLRLAQGASAVCRTLDTARERIVAASR